MKYAEKVSDIPNAFKHYPLEAKELGTFYFDGTMEFRTGNKYSSPILDIFEACQIPFEQNAFLLLGHKGCGKSTELNKMSYELMKKGYQVLTVECGKDLDMNNTLYTDLLILMGEALLKIADKIECCLNKDMINKVMSFWSTDIEENLTDADSEERSLEAGIQAESPKFLKSILQVFARVKADLKYSEERRTVYRKRISHRSSDWLSVLRLVADEITKKLNGRQPVIIFEDFDKINPEDAWKVFFNHAATLAGVSFPIIYTFPIALSYDPRFAALEGYFNPKTLPMIKQKTMDGEKYSAGIDVIIEIVKKRAKLDLFGENVLETLIEKTGGSLRDLFSAINTSAKIAYRRDSDVILTEDMRVALIELKTSLTRRIESKHYEFLSDIYKGNRQRINSKEMLLEMLLASTVFEYNGERWHNVHPLVADFLVDQGLV